MNALENLKIKNKTWFLLILLSIITIIPSSILLEFFEIKPNKLFLILISLFYCAILILWILLLYYNVFLKKIQAIRLYEELNTVENYNTLLKHELTVPLRIIEKGIEKNDIKTCSDGLIELNNKLSTFFINNINGLDGIDILKRLNIHYKSIYLHPPTIIWNNYNIEQINNKYKHNILVYLLILIDNALEASANTIKIKSYINEGYLYILVTDNGHGILNEKNELLNKYNKIFKYSYSFKKVLSDSLIKKKNTGCGLYLIKKQLETNKSTIMVKENTKNGVTFEIKMNIKEL